MGAFFSYTIYSGVFLIMLFLLYKVFLSSEKQIALNRFLLLICYALAFLAWPINQIEWKATDVGAQPLAMIGELTFQPIAMEGHSQSIIPQILIWIYLSGVVSVLLISLFSIAKLFLYLRKGNIYRHEGYKLIVMPDYDSAPFSIGKNIVISSSDYETVRDVVVSHELAHIRCCHYLDLILAQIVCVVLWYNPAAWLMRDELKLIHEYQADSSVLDSGIDARVYQMLLIRKSVGNRVHTLANNLNHSKLKNRISMMQKEKGGILSRMRVLTLIIALAVALAIVNIPAVATGLQSLDEATLELTTEGVETTTDVKNERMDSENIVAADFPGGTKKLMQFLAENLRYPEVAQKENRSGRSIVGYKIGADGKISNIKILKSSWPDLDEEAIRVVKKMPDWTPAKSNGTFVASEFALPVDFRLPSVSDANEVAIPNFSGTKLDDIVVVGYGAVEKANVDSPTAEKKVINLNDSGNSDVEPEVYIDGVKHVGIPKDLSPDKIESITVYRAGGNDDYPDGAVLITLKK